MFSAVGNRRLRRRTSGASLDRSLPWGGPLQGRFLVWLLKTENLRVCYKDIHGHAAIARRPRKGLTLGCC